MTRTIWNTWTNHTVLSAPFRHIYPNVRQVNSLRMFTPKVGDLVVLWGGGDIPPVYYNEQNHKGNDYLNTPWERDKLEYSVIRQSIQYNIPMVGICRGAQWLCVAAGGRLFQDVRGHMMDHMVMTNTGEEFKVSSMHHQMMRPLNVPHELLAFSENIAKDIKIGENSPPIQPNELDINPEAIFFPHINGLAFQWHPETGQKNDGYVNYTIEQIKERFA